MPKVTIGEETHEVDASAIEFGEDESPPEGLLDGYVHQDDVDGIVQKRLSRKERTLKSDLKQDDAFFREAAGARGIALREDGKPKGTVNDDELEELRKQASLVEELQQQNEQLQSERQKARRTHLHNQVLKQVDRLQEGAEDDFLASVERQMTYDEEYGWVKTDESGEIQYAGGEPVGVDAVIEETREAKPYFFREQERNNGSSYKGSRGGGRSGKKKSDFSMEEKAQFYAEARAAGKDPTEEWNKLAD